MWEVVKNPYSQENLKWFELNFNAQSPNLFTAQYDTAATKCTYMIDLATLRVIKTVGCIRLGFNDAMLEVRPTGCRYAFHSCWFNLSSTNGRVSAAAFSYQMC